MQLLGVVEPIVQGPVVEIAALMFAVFAVNCVKIRIFHETPYLFVTLQTRPPT